MDDWRAQHDDRLAARDWDALLELYRARLGEWDEDRWDACIPGLQAIYAGLGDEDAAQLDACLSWLCFEATGGDEARAQAWSGRALEGVDVDPRAISHELLFAVQTWQLARRHAWAVAQGRPEEEIAEILRYRLLVADSLPALIEPLRGMMALTRRSAQRELKELDARISEADDLARVVDYYEQQRRAYGEYVAAMERRIGAAVALIEGAGLDAYSFEDRVHAACLLLGRAYSNLRQSNELIARALASLLLPDDDDPLFTRHWGEGAAFMALVHRATTPSRRDVIRELGRHASEDSDELEVICISGQEDQSATGNERALLLSAREPPPLAHVHFRRAQHGSFTLDAQGRVKWLGKMKLSLDWHENAVIYRGAALGLGAGFERPAELDDDAAVTAWARYIAARVTPDAAAPRG
ncbi:MAG: hypothetical protein H6713_06765 [Myxococcales bacterium]|nr:hypothetical protein [Myxococcales bacterium]MCB9749696.1 hypothetical protein [Myxococcales bacterium]